jgi:hypothetical protein
MNLGVPSAPDLPMDCGPFYLCARSIGMNLDACPVQRHSFDLDAHDLLALKLLEHLVQHASVGPPAHARIGRMPVAKSLRQSAPLATMLGDIQHRVHHLQIGHADIAALQRQAMLDPGELFGRDLQAAAFRQLASKSQLVLTRPSKALGERSASHCLRTS